MDSALKHSDVVFVGEAEPESYGAYGTTVVAWGGGPRSANEVDDWKKRFKKARKLGIRYCSNIWMLTATSEILAADPSLRQAVCLDVNNHPIVPPWLRDRVHKGVPSYWGCTNHPRFRRHLRDQVTFAILAGAEGLHLDDHVGTANVWFSPAWLSLARLGLVGPPGCFCDFCMQGFRDYLGDKYSPDELREKDIDDAGSFDYHEMIRRVADDLQGFMKAYERGEVPLMEDFLTFQLKAAARLVEELGGLAEKLRGKRIPVSANSSNLDPRHLVDSPYLECFVAEISHHAQEGRIPTRAIFAYKLADALGKPVAATADGGDWAHVKERNLTGLVKLWVVLSYAFGHRLMPPHNQWCYTHEKGTHWYKGPMKEYAPLYRFVRNNADIFDGYEALEQVGVIYSNLAYRQGERAVHDACRGLLRANVPFGLVLAGDDWLISRLAEEESSRFELIVVPEPTLLDGEQRRVIDKWVADGRAIPWVNEKNVLERVEPLTSLESASKVWMLPRKIPGRQDAPVVCHVVNWSYNASTDRMNRQSHVRVHVANKLFGRKKARNVTLLSPEREPTELSFEIRPDGISLTIPEVNLYGILRLAC